MLTSNDEAHILMIARGLIDNIKALRNTGKDGVALESALAHAHRIELIINDRPRCSTCGGTGRERACPKCGSKDIVHDVEGFDCVECGYHFCGRCDECHHGLFCRDFPFEATEA